MDAMGFVNLEGGRGAENNFSSIKRAPGIYYGFIAR